MYSAEVGVVFLIDMPTINYRLEFLYSAYNSQEVNSIICFVYTVFPRQPRGLGSYKTSQLVNLRLVKLTLYGKSKVRGI